MAMNFDPRGALKRIKVGREGGRQVEVDYLQVKDRVTWVRLEHLDAHMETVIAHIDDRVVVVRALVSLSNGGSATGHGSAATAATDAVEKAETAAVGRALGYLGYGTQAALLEEVGVVDAPAERGGEETGERGDGEMRRNGETREGRIPTDGGELARLQVVAGRPAEPAADLMPSDPAEAVKWFRARVALMPALTIAEEQKAEVAKAIAHDLRAAGMSDSVRLAMYRALTGKESGTAMDPRELALLAQLTCRAKLLEQIGMQAEEAAGPATAAGSRGVRRNGGR